MNEYMSYEEYLEKVKTGILTEDGNCPVAPLLIMLQGKRKTQVLTGCCICAYAGPIKLLLIKDQGRRG